ncbi:MAG: DinB family protein [Ferruginibacter sp.]
MKETQRIIKLLEDAYNGSPWIDVSLIPVLKKITAEQAAKKFSPQWNSIWEIVNHIISWRANVLRRIKGEVIQSPSHNYFVPVKNTSSNAWVNTLKKLEASQQQWIRFLKKFKEKDFEKIYPDNDLSYYEHIHGIIQHDIYHLGQIVLLSKAV